MIDFSHVFEYCADIGLNLLLSKSMDKQQYMQSSNEYVHICMYYTRIYICIVLYIECVKYILEPFSYSVWERTIRRKNKAIYSAAVDTFKVTVTNKNIKCKIIRMKKSRLNFTKVNSFELFDPHGCLVGDEWHKKPLHNWMFSYCDYWSKWAWATVQKSIEKC